MKKQGFDILKGQTIVSFHIWEQPNYKAASFKTTTHKYNLEITDEGAGGNDSDAYLESITGGESIIGQEIVEVTEESDNYGAIIKLITDNSKCVITIIHDHNGYYGFDYEVCECEL